MVYVNVDHGFYMYEAMSETWILNSKKGRSLRAALENLSKLKNLESVSKPTATSSVSTPASSPVLNSTIAPRDSVIA